MTARVTADTTMRVVLDAPGAQAALAADVLARAAGITAAEAHHRLSQPANLAVLPAQPARHLVAMLRLFGLLARAEPLHSPIQPTERHFDLSVQWARPEKDPMPAAALAAALGRVPRAVAVELASPAGLVVAGLDRAALAQWQFRLKPLRALRLVASDPAAALYDLLLLPGAPTNAALLRDLARLGLARCPLTGAIGAGLDRVMRDYVARRHPGAPVLAVNRDFQRFDLMLTGAPELSPADLDGFLRTRTCGHYGTATTPLRIECALPRADALAFQSDYAAIGIDTDARLVWPHAAGLS